ncbi:MAG TPA: PPC domain-containing protein, partial [Blastocatellia bacterium]
MKRCNATRRFLTLFLILTGLSLWLILPEVPRAFVAAPAAAQSGGELDAERRAKLEELLAQMKSGAPFSLEEADILRRYAAGQAINPLTADTLISRALYYYFVTREELTREQEDLLARYAAASATREHDLADRKRELYERRKAAAEAAPPVPAVAPANDLCSAAENIPGAGPFPYLTAVTADITDATTAGDPPTPSCTLCGSVSRSIWYRFTPAVTAAYSISTCQLDGTATTVLDTEMAIYTSSNGTCGGAFTQLPNNSGAVDGCDGDSCVSLGFQSRITTSLNAGTSYFILVWLCESAPPVAGETAVQLLVNRITPPANDNCASAEPLTLNIPVAGTTVAAMNDYQLSGAGCFTGIGNGVSNAEGRDVVYSFTAPSTGKYSFRVTNYDASLDPVLYVASACPAATPGIPVNVASCVAAANRTVPDGTSEEVACVNLTSAQQVFIFVDESFLNTNTGSAFTIEVQRCTQEAAPNDTPATATPYAFGMEGSISPAGDVDFISLGTPATGSRVFALVDGVAANSNDFDLRITTSTDTLEYDDANADALFGRFSGTVGGAPASGSQIFARISHFSAATQAEPYRFYAIAQPPINTATAESEPNDTIATADTAANRYFSGSLPGPAPSVDVDIFSFTATAGEVIFLGLDSDPLRNNTPINARLALLDASGNLLVQVNDSSFFSNTTPGAGSLTSITPNSPAEALTFRVPATGTYYAQVAIGTTSTGTFAAGDYLLSITTGATGMSAVKFGSTPGAEIAKATRTGEGIVIEWSTAHEVDNLGFNLYRVEGGRRAQINSQLIAGSALMVGPRVSLEAGHSYAWLDKSPGAASEYWIEDVGLDGRGRLHGPVKVAIAGKNSATRAMKAQSVLLNDLVGDRAAA